MRHLQNLSWIGLLILAACGNTTPLRDDPDAAAIQGRTAASLGSCRLAAPIETGRSDLVAAMPLVLTDVKLNQSIRTETLLPHDSLKLQLFLVQNTQHVAGALEGVSSNGGYAGRIGFANVYLGSSNFTGGMSRVNGSAIYSTQTIQTYQSAGVEQKAITEVKIETRDTRILGVQLVVPVEVRRDSLSVRFSGENQTLCITSARLP